MIVFYLRFDRFLNVAVKLVRDILEYKYWKDLFKNFFSKQKEVEYYSLIKV